MPSPSSSSRRALRFIIAPKSWELATRRTGLLRVQKARRVLALVGFEFLIRGGDRRGAEGRGEESRLLWGGAGLTERDRRLLVVAVPAVVVRKGDEVFVRDNSSSSFDTLCPFGGFSREFWGMPRKLDMIFE